MFWQNPNQIIRKCRRRCEESLIGNLRIPKCETCHLFSYSQLSAPQPFQQFPVNSTEPAIAEHANDVAALRVPGDVSHN